MSPPELSDCRLLGGPYDGDTGSMVKPLPDRIWCFKCPHQDSEAPRCRYNGVHWVTSTQKATAVDAEIYHHDHVNEHGEHIYRHADLELDPLATEREQELVGAGGQVHAGYPGELRLSAPRIWLDGEEVMPW